MSETKKLINQAVVHKSLGKGVIRSADEKYLEVYFPEKGRNSRFSYPSCFDGFMVLENSELQSDVTAAVEIWRVESGAASKEKIRQQYENTMKRIEARKASVEEKKIKAARRLMEHRPPNTGCH